MKNSIITLTAIAILLTAVSFATFVTDDMTINLSDETFVGNLKWKELKEAAMQPEFEKELLFVSYCFFLIHSFRESCTSRIKKL